MNRRALLKALGSTFLLAGGGAFPSGLFAQEGSAPLLPLLHVFGELPAPAAVRRVFAAGAPAAMALNSLTPQELVGWPSALPRQAQQWLSPYSRSLPVVGRLAGRGSTISSEQLLLLAPDVIVDMGDVNEHYLSMARQFSAQVGIPYVLVSGRLHDSPEQLKTLGALLGRREHGQYLADMAQEILDDIKARRKQHEGTLPSVYFARSANGLETGVGASIHSEVINLVGARSVASDLPGERLGQVSMEQLLLWNPDVIFTQEVAFYRQVYEHSQWRMLPAVQKKRVFLVPNVPFGWLDTPPGVNRLLGAMWLAAWMYNEDQSLLISKLQRFFVLYYGHEPSANALRDLLDTPDRFAA